MTNHLATYKSDTEHTECQVGIPIVKQLNAIFRAVPIAMARAFDRADLTVYAELLSYLRKEA